MRKPTNSKLFKNVLRTYYVPGSIPGVGETAVNNTDGVPTLMELMTWGTGRKYGEASTLGTDGRRDWGTKIS